MIDLAISLIWFAVDLVSTAPDGVSSSSSSGVSTSGVTSVGDFSSVFSTVRVGGYGVDVTDRGIDLTGTPLGVASFRAALGVIHPRELLRCDFESDGVDFGVLIDVEAGKASMARVVLTGRDR